MKFIFFSVSLLLCAISTLNAQIETKSPTLKKNKVFKTSHKGYFSQDGTRLSLLSQNQIKIVSIPAGKEICKTDVFSDSVTPLSSPFSPDGKKVAINYYIYDEREKTVTQNISLINASSCKEEKLLAALPSKNVGDYLSFSPDGNRIAASTDVPAIWDVEKGKSETYPSLIPKDYQSKNALLSPKGKWLVSYAEAFIAPDTFGAFYVIDLQTKAQKKINEDRIIDFKFSRDSTLLVTMSRIWKTKSVIKIKVYETAGWTLKNEFEIDDEDNNKTFGLSPDKKLIAVGGFGKFKIFSLQTGKMLVEEYHYKRTLSDDIFDVPHLISFLIQVEFSPDGKTLLTGGEDLTVKLWNLNNI